MCCGPAKGGQSDHTVQRLSVAAVGLQPGAVPHATKAEGGAGGGCGVWVGVGVGVGVWVVVCVCVGVWVVVVVVGGGGGRR